MDYEVMKLGVAVIRSDDDDPIPIGVISGGSYIDMDRVGEWLAKPTVLSSSLKIIYSTYCRELLATRLAVLYRTLSGVTPYLRVGIKLELPRYVSTNCVSLINRFVMPTSETLPPVDALFFRGRQEFIWGTGYGSFLTIPTLSYLLFFTERDGVFFKDMGINTPIRDIVHAIYEHAGYIFSNDSSPEFNALFTAMALWRSCGGVDRKMPTSTSFHRNTNLLSPDGIATHMFEKYATPKEFFDFIISMGMEGMVGSNTRQRLEAKWGMPYGLLRDHFFKQKGLR